jgi:hypothetical protein
MSDRAAINKNEINIVGSAKLSIARYYWKRT